MRPVTAVKALRSARGAALLIALTASIAAPLPALAAPVGANEPVNVIISFRGPGGEGKKAVKAEGGRIRQTFHLIDAVSARVPRGRMASLERKAAVKSVELDHKLATLDHVPATGNAELEAAWGVEHIGAGDVQADGNTGEGIKVGVIDTGIDYNHPDLDDVYVGGYDVFNNDADPFDDNGHGTHVAGSLAAELNAPPAGVVGVAPDVDLYAYKVLDATGSGEYSGLIAALDRAVTVDDVDVVNMSLGAHEVSAALQAEVEAVYAAGVVLVAASGNVDPLTGQACPVAFPAAYEQVFATSFTGPDDALTGYSCTGPEVDFSSPGDLINSTVPTGSCMFCAPSGYSGDMSGTSMASPHLAGTVALVLAAGIANSGDTATRADDVKAHLCANTAVGTGVTYFGFFHVPIAPTDPRYPDWFGCGVLDANKALITNPPPGAEPNSPPVAVEDSASVPENGSVFIDVLANDTDADDDGLSVGGLGAPSHGTASVEPSGEILYAPTTNFTGTDSFTYDVTDGLATDTGTVTVNVGGGNDPPVANADTAASSEAWPVSINVLANDTDPDGDAVSLDSVTQPAHGTAVISGSAVAYTPAPGFSGVDTFSYDVSDGQGGTATGTVTVTVSATPRQMHVTDLDAAATRQTTRWTAKVTIRVRNSSGGAVSNVVVRGTWSTGDSVTCNTGTAGNCTVTKSKIGNSRTSVTFKVTAATKTGWAYLASANFDVEGDSNGTLITVFRP